MAENRPAIDLAEVIDSRVEPPPVWIAYPGSETFQVLVRPLGNRQQEMIDAAQVISWDTATMSRKITLDQQQYLKLFCEFVICDWRGLAVADLRRLVLLLDPEKIQKMSGEVGCDEGAKLLLMQHSVSFNAWLNRVCRDVERYNQEREESLEKKPSRPSVSGSTTRQSTVGNAARTMKPTALNRTATPARSTPGGTRPSRSWRSITWPAPGVIWTSSGLRRLCALLRSLSMSSPCTGGSFCPSTA